MKNLTARQLVKYGITTGICLIFAVVYFFVNIPLNVIPETPLVDIVRILCDAFFVPGMLTLMIGLLMWVASEGALDGVSYLGSYLVKTLIPGKHAEVERYGDYVERKHASRKRGFGFLCVVGLGFVLISCVFLALFYALY